MSQQLSPWIEGAYGWNFGESNWNTGIDTNQLKFSFLFDRNVDGVVGSLPSAVNGQAYFLTTDNRLYFAVGTTWFSSPTPKWFEFAVRSTGVIYQFNGVSALQIDSPEQIETRLEAAELILESLGTAAFQDTTFFATQANLDIVAAQAADYTDALRQDLGDVSAPRVVGNIATLRTLPDAGSKTAFVLGHTLFGLGGGMYSQVASDVSSADNNGSVIVAASGMRWKLVNSSELNPFQFGARGDKVTDDTDAIQACYDAVPLGGTMRVYKAPGAAYIVSQQGASGYCLDFSRPVNIVSDGVYASFQPAAGTVVNTVRLKPDPAFYYGGITWDGLSLQDPYTGSRQGFHGIFIDTDVAGSNLPGALFTRISVGQGSVSNGVGIMHLNNATNNVNGAMFGCTIEHGPGIKGGITLEQSGDSNVIRNNIISGSGVGVFFNLITGASLLSIIDNNITTLGGAVRGSSGSRFRIWNNNCEQIAPTVGVTYMINIDGASGTMSSGSIRGNHLGAFTATGITSNIRINNCVGCKIENNVMLPAAASQNGIIVSAACADTSIGANTYGSDIAALDRVSDAGVGTMGVRRTAALVNGWVDFGAGFDTLHFYKTNEGVVHIGGTIKSGTVTIGTALFTLPEGFRPAALRLLPITQSAGAGQIFGCISVNSSGGVAIQAGANNQFSLDGVCFLASNGADAVSNL